MEWEWNGMALLSHCSTDNVVNEFVERFAAIFTRRAIGPNVSPDNKVMIIGQC